MVNTKPQSLLFRIIYKLVSRNKPQKGLKTKKREIIFGKRQKFGVGVVLLSCGLFLAEYALNTYGLLTAFFLAVFSDVILFWAIQQDLQDNFSAQVFILPFFYSLSFGLFSFLTPAR